MFATATRTRFKQFADLSSKCTNFRVNYEGVGGDSGWFFLDVRWSSFLLLNLQLVNNWLVPPGLLPEGTLAVTLVNGERAHNLTRVFRSKSVYLPRVLSLGIYRHGCTCFPSLPCSARAHDVTSNRFGHVTCPMVLCHVYVLEGSGSFRHVPHSTSHVLK